MPKHFFYTILLASLILEPMCLVGQENEISQVNSVGISFQKVDIGHGVQLDYRRALSEDWALGIGLYVHLNFLPRDDQNHQYHNRGWAQQWYQHLGLNVDVSRNLLEYEHTSLYTFFNIHALRTGFRESVYQPYQAQNGEIIFKKFEGYIYGPYLTLENTIGLGISTMLTEKVGFRIRGGLGISIFYDDDAPPSNFTNLLGSNNWGGMTMLSTGLFFRF